MNFTGGRSAGSAVTPPAGSHWGAGPRHFLPIWQGTFRSELCKSRPRTKGAARATPALTLTSGRGAAARSGATPWATNLLGGPDGEAPLSGG